MHTQFDKLVDQFESDLKAGNSPRIDRWLEKVPEVSKPPFLLELISLEIFYRLQRGENVAADEYARFGEAAFDHADETIKRSRQGWETQDSLPSQVAAAQRIGRYKLLQKIGEGGMGAVWMAEQEEPVKRRVAIKLIKSELASKEVIARFEAERQALAMMEHNNIAKVLDAGTTEGGTPYFVMELVKGVPITKYCDQHKLSVEERLRLFLPICKAVQHAHQKGILHRDLKPSNVLVTHYDGEAIPKVIDFGMAKAVSHNMRLTDKTLFTEFGKVVGTLQYMSPEQAELDALDVDTRSDIYSLGIMLYELLTGSTPVDKKTISSNQFFQVLEIIREKDPPRPSNLLNSSAIDAIKKVSEERKVSTSRLKQVLKGDLDWVVMKALDKDRTRRYQTADDFARDVSNYLEGEAVIARPPSTVYQIQKFAAKNRGLVASILAVGLVLLAGIIGTSSGLIRANRKTAEAETNRILAETKKGEADEARKAAKESERIAIVEKDKALKNEKRAIAAERRASIETERVRESEANAKFQLANARYDANRAIDARALLHEIPAEFRDTFEWNYCNRKFLGSDITCFGHTNKIFKVAFSPDGKTFASASADQTIKIWDAVSGRELLTLIGHAGSVGSIAFSPSGKQLASASSDATVKLWDVQTGQEIGTITGHSALVATVVFSPDGERLATASDDMTVKLWDTLTYENLRTFEGHTGEVGSVVFSPDGGQIVSSSVDRTVRIWDTESGEEVSTLNGHDAFVISVAWSPDGKRLASASFDTVKLWDPATGEATNTLIGHTQFVHNVAFSPDGTRLASSGRDKSIKIWNVDTGLEIMTLKGHADWVNGVAFSPDGSRLVSGSYDRTVKVWDTRSGRHINTISGHSDVGTQVVFSPDGSRLASSSFDETVKIWEANSGQEIVTFNGHQNAVRCLAFSPDGDMVASAGSSGKIKLWDASSGQEVSLLLGHKGSVYGVDFCPKGLRLVSGGQDKSIRVWNVESEEESLVLDGHRGKVNCVAFSPDGLAIASASDDRTIRLWDGESGEERRVLQGHFGQIRNVAFSSDGKWLASASSDRTIKMWEVKTGREVATLSGHTEPVNSVSFNQDGTRLVSASADKMVKLWDVETQCEIMTLRGHVGGGVKSVTFSPDGYRIASIGEDASIEMWEARRSIGVTTLTGHEGPVFQVSFNDDDTRLFSRSQTESLVWGVESKTELDDCEFELPEQIQRFSRDGRWFVTAETNHVVLVDREHHSSSPQENGFLIAKSKFDAHWHQQRAKIATANRNWFAAVFHGAWLVRNNPDYAEYHDSLHAAHQKLVADFDQDGKEVDGLLSSFVQEALSLPRGERMPKISASQVRAINGDVWSRVSTKDAFQKAPLTDAEIRLFRDAVGQNPLAIYYNTLGTAEYRLGNFAEAIAAATLSVERMPDELGAETPYPGDYAILAMSNFKLGQSEQVKQYRVKLLDVMTRPEYKDDNECISFLVEVEQLLGPKSNSAGKGEDAGKESS